MRRENNETVRSTVDYVTNEKDQVINERERRKALKQSLRSVKKSLGKCRSDVEIFQNSLFVLRWREERCFYIYMTCSHLNKYHSDKLSIRLVCSCGLKRCLHKRFYEWIIHLSCTCSQFFICLFLDKLSIFTTDMFYSSLTLRYLPNFSCSDLFKPVSWSITRIVKCRAKCRKEACIVQ